ncbi:MAG: hypothetical protein Q8J61_03415, partial [Sulfuricella sp.]|nr:hypothetical protein [Sulfuricella sp.]
MKTSFIHAGSKATLTWPRLLAMFALALLWMMPVAAQSDDLWVKPGPDGQPQLQLYFYWTTACP